MRGDARPRAPPPLFRARALRAFRDSDPVPSAGSAILRVAPGCFRMLGDQGIPSAAPVPLRCRPPTAFPVLPIFLCLQLQLLPGGPAPYPATVSKNAPCPPRPSSPGPYQTPTSVPSQGKVLGEGEGRSSRWPDPESEQKGHLGGMLSEFSKDGFEGVTGVHTVIGIHPLSNSHRYVLTHYVCSHLPHAFM